MHTPHHVAQAWIDRNKGRFDEGWDDYRKEAFARQKRLGVIPAGAKLTPRPAGLPAWSSLSADQKRLYAHQMEVFSAFLEETDAEVGRLIDTLRRKPGGDNLLVFYIVGDNGGSAEGDLEGSIQIEGAAASGAPNDFALQLANYDQLGGPDLANHYAAGWAWATTTPFRWMKQVASHFGGTRNPLIVDWPGHTAQPGRVRGQFSHVNAIAPTILDILGVELPDTVNGIKQIPFEGRSLLPTFTDPDAPDVQTEQYFEIFGNRAIYKDGWVAAAKRSYQPWNLLKDLSQIYKDDTADDRWELYHVATDFSEADDLATRNPAKLAELKAEFVREGTRNGVFPLVPLPVGAPKIVDPARRDFVFASDTSGLPPNALPALAGKPHRWEVAIVGDAASGTGVLLAQGGRLGGYVLYAKDGHLAFENNTFGQGHQVIVASAALPPGAASVGFDFVPAPGTVAARSNVLGTPPGDGTVRLLVNGAVVAEGLLRKYPATAGALAESFDIGRDRGSLVSKEAAARQPYSQPLGDARLTLQQGE